MATWSAPEDDIDAGSGDSVWGEGARQKWMDGGQRDIRGDAEPYKRCFSHTTDISLANPFKPAAMGWMEADETITQAATYWREGE